MAAIAALAGNWLFGGSAVRLFGWSWPDPVMGIVGAVLVAVWGKGLIVDTRKIPLDREKDHPFVDEIRPVIAERGSATDTVVADLHAWRVGKATDSCAPSLLTHAEQRTPKQVRDGQSVHDAIVHATIETHHCATS